MRVVQCKPSHLAEVVTSLHLLMFYSRYWKTYFLRKKSEDVDKFKEFKVAVEKIGMNIKALRADRGSKYLSEEYKQFLKECGIHSESTAAYSPQYNGVSERLNRTLQLDP